MEKKDNFFAYPTTHGARKGRRSVTLLSTRISQGGWYAEALNFM